MYNINNTKQKIAVKLISCSLKEFKEKYPDCILLDSQYCEQYNKLIIEAMGGNGDDDIAKEQKIMKNITKNITLNKQELIQKLKNNK